MGTCPAWTDEEQCLYTAYNIKLINCQIVPHLIMCFARFVLYLLVFSLFCFIIAELSCLTVLLIGMTSYIYLYSYFYVPILLNYLYRFFTLETLIYILYVTTKPKGDIFDMIMPIKWWNSLDLKPDNVWRGKSLGNNSFSAQFGYKPRP